MPYKIDGGFLGFSKKTKKNRSTSPISSAKTYKQSPVRNSPVKMSPIKSSPILYTSTPKQSPIDIPDIPDDIFEFGKREPDIYKNLDKKLMLEKLLNDRFTVSHLERERKQFGSNIFWINQQALRKSLQDVDSDTTVKKMLNKLYKFKELLKKNKDNNIRNINTKKDYIRTVEKSIDGVEDDQQSIKITLRNIDRIINTVKQIQSGGKKTKKYKKRHKNRFRKYKIKRRYSRKI